MKASIRKGLANVNTNSVSISLFEPALYEVFILMETDCLTRFKRAVAKDHKVFSDVVWEELGIAKPYMTYDEFEQYSWETPSLFHFIDKLYESLVKEMYSAEIARQVSKDDKVTVGRLPPKFESFSE